MTGNSCLIRICGRILEGVVFFCKKLYFKTSSRLIRKMCLCYLKFFEEIFKIIYLPNKPNRSMYFMPGTDMIPVGHPAEGRSGENAGGGTYKSATQTRLV